MQEEEEEIIVVTPKATSNENELIQMNEFLRNLDVTFEIVSPIEETEFQFTLPTSVNEIKVKDAQIIRQEIQSLFTFDIPAEKPKTAEPKSLFDITEETKQIEVKQPIEFVPITEVEKDGIIKYSLEEYMEVENDILNSKPIADVKTEVIPEELKITMKVQEAKSPDFPTHFDAISPVEMTIEETLKMRADDRRRKLKDFNYKFQNNNSKFEDLEKEPAYKRSGIELQNNQNKPSQSRTSLGSDSNNETQLRSNNSFLHDNVD
jgi:cell division protein FtsZ